MFKRISKPNFHEFRNIECTCSIFQHHRNDKKNQFGAESNKNLRNFSLNNKSNKEKISISSIKKMNESKSIKYSQTNTEAFKEIQVKQNTVRVANTHIHSTINITKHFQVAKQPSLTYKAQRNSLTFRNGNTKVFQQHPQRSSVNYFNSVTNIPKKYSQNMSQSVGMYESQNRMLFSFNPLNQQNQQRLSVAPKQPQNFVTVNQQLAKMISQQSTEESGFQSNILQQLPIKSKHQRKAEQNQVSKSFEDSPVRVLGFRRIQSFQSGDKSQDDVRSVVVRHYPVNNLKSPYRSHFEKIINNEKVTRMSELSNMFDNQADIKLNQFLDQ